MYYEEIEAVEYRGIIAGPEVTALTVNVKLKANEGLKKGTILSETNGECEMVTSETMAEYILAEDVEATTETVIAPAYVRGFFRGDRLIVADGDKIENHSKELRMRSIYIAKEN